MGFPFGILWAAEQCGLLSGKVRTSGTEVNISCPLCGDKGTHFAINVAKDTWNCPRCGTGGGLIDLYARCHPDGPTDRKSAARELFQMWESGHGMDETSKSAAQRRRLEAIKERTPSDTIAPIERRDAAYRALLNYLPGLTDEHEQNLRERGLTYADIERLGFKSLEAEKKYLLVPKTLDTTDVAGFYTKSGHRFVNIDNKWILIPYQDLFGRIGMLEMRMFGGKRRYLRFSSGNPSEERSECSKSVSTIHHVGIDLKKPPSKVYLTEGGLKADVANALSGGTMPFLAMAGVNNPCGLKEALQDLESIGLKTVIMAFDMDLYANPNVRKGLERAVTVAREIGLAVKFMRWNLNYKGIDDYLLAKYHHSLEDSGAA